MDVEVFERSRGRLQAIAYRMLGSVADAEDAVQDTFLRWQASDRAQLESPEAWLTKVLTNLCLNQLSSARVRRETYVGRWLPEPVFAGDPMLGPAETAEQRESVSFAVLALMERLSPNERAVYVLREAFGYPHAEIAQILELSEANCQQIYRRAKQHVTAAGARSPVDPSAARKIAEEFLAAALSGDTAPLVKLLTDDVTSVADGGGHVPARSVPIVGALTIARFLQSVMRPSVGERFVGGAIEMSAELVNGGPALVATVGDRIVGVIVLEVRAGQVAELYIQANPFKLERMSGNAGLPGQ